jgi:hypothetical protein
MKKYRVIEIGGYSKESTTALYFDGKIFESATFFAKDFDYGEKAEAALEECKLFIKQKEENDGWVPDVVTCWISEFDIEEIEQ